MQIATELYQRLIEKSDDTFCLIAIEHNIARAVLIAHLSDKKRRTTWIWQARAQPGFKYSQLMFEGLRQWARAKGCRKIENGISDERVMKILERRYGFRRKGKDIYCDL